MPAVQQPGLGLLPGFQALTNGRPDGTTDWINAWSYGADPSATTDSAPAINAALQAAGPGSSVYLPDGSYLIGSGLTIPGGVELLGSQGNKHIPNGATLLLMPNFTGSAVISFPAGSSEQRITRVNINGALAAANSVIGIAANLGEAQYVQLSDILITGGGISNGIATNNGGSAQANGWRCRNVVVLNVAGTGILLRNQPDTNWTDCQSIGSGSFGWTLTNCQNSKFTGCRADFSATSGLHITGAWSTGTGSGGCQFVNFSTDRNGQHGVLVDASAGNNPMVFTGLMCRRDGSGSTTAGYAGLATSTTTLPVVADGMTCYPGVNDDGTGNASPQYGINVIGTLTYLGVSNAFLHAITAGTNGVISNWRALATRTGTTSAPSAITLVADSA